MESAELKKSFDELLTEYNLPEQIGRLYQKAVDSGALNIAGESGQDYRMAKVIWYAIILKLKDAATPYHPATLREAQNLSHFL